MSQAWISRQPSIPHFLSPSIGLVHLTTDADPRGLAEVVVVPVSRELRPLGRAACRLLLEAHEDYQSWVWEHLDPPGLGSLVWAEHHGYPFEILLAVMAETNQRPVVSPTRLVERVCSQALLAAERKNVESIAICTLGEPTREAGRETARAIRGHLERRERPMAEQTRARSPWEKSGGCTVIYNASEPAEVSGANDVLSQWWKDTLHAFQMGNPYFILEEDDCLLQEGEGSQEGGEEDTPTQTCKQEEGSIFPPCNQINPDPGKKWSEFFSDSESGEEGFEPPGAERNSHPQTLSRINQLSAALLEKGLEKRSEARDGAREVREEIDELAAEIDYPEHTSEGEVHAVCGTLQALVEEVAYFEPYPDTHHRYRSWNHVSGLALMEDERGYPTLDSSQLPTKADMAIAHKRVRGIAVPT